MSDIYFRPQISTQSAFEAEVKLRKSKAEDNATEFVVFLKTLQTLLQMNRPMSEIVEMLYDNSSGQFKTEMKIIMDEVKSGKNLGTAFSNASFFPEDFSKIFAVGQNSGSFTAVMENYISYAEKTMGMRKALQSAMTYPTVMIAFIVCAFVFIITFVIPSFKELVANMTVGMDYVELNLPTELLFALHSLIAPLGKVIPMIGVCVFIGYMFMRGKLTMAAFFERNIPKLRQVKNELDWGQWLALGGIAIKAGMNPPAMLQMLSGGNLPKEIKSKYASITFAVNGGSSLSDELRKADVPLSISNMLAAAESSGYIDRTLKDLSEILLGGVEHKIKNVTEIMNPIITVSVAFVVGVIVASLLAVMSSMNTLAMQM